MRQLASFTQRNATRFRAKDGLNDVLDGGAITGILMRLMEIVGVMASADTRRRDIMHQKPNDSFREKQIAAVRRSIATACAQLFIENDLLMTAVGGDMGKAVIAEFQRLSRNIGYKDPFNPEPPSTEKPAAGKRITKKQLRPNAYTKPSQVIASVIASDVFNAGIDSRAAPVTRIAYKMLTEDHTAEIEGGGLCENALSRVIAESLDDLISQEVLTIAGSKSKKAK